MTSVCLCFDRDRSYKEKYREEKRDNDDGAVMLVLIMIFFSQLLKLVRDAITQTEWILYNFRVLEAEIKKNAADA